MTAGRLLTYCMARALGGPDLADELYGRRLPSGFDCDFPPDQDMAERIARERRQQEEECAACASRNFCHH